MNLDEAFEEYQDKLEEIDKVSKEATEKARALLKEWGIEMSNPHPKFIMDETSGAKVRNQRHDDVEVGKKIGYMKGYIDGFHIGRSLGMAIPKESEARRLRESKTDKRLRRD